MGTPHAKRPFGAPRTRKREKMPSFWPSVSQNDANNGVSGVAWGHFAAKLGNWLCFRAFFAKTTKNTVFLANLGPKPRFAWVSRWWLLIFGLFFGIFGIFGPQNGVLPWGETKNGQKTMFSRCFWHFWWKKPRGHLRSGPGDGAVFPKNPRIAKPQVAKPSPKCPP